MSNAKFVGVEICPKRAEEMPCSLHGPDALLLVFGEGVFGEGVPVEDG